MNKVPAIIAISTIVLWFFIGAVCIYDIYLYVNNMHTLSDYIDMWAFNRSFGGAAPLLLVLFGIFMGSIGGFTTGLLVGHLFWPNMIDDRLIKNKNNQI